MNNNSSTGAILFAWMVMSLLFGVAMAGKALLNAAFQRWPLFHQLCRTLTHAVCWMLAAGLWALLGAIIGCYIAAFQTNPWP